MGACTVYFFEVGSLSGPSYFLKGRIRIQDPVKLRPDPEFIAGKCPVPGAGGVEDGRHAGLAGDEPPKRLVARFVCMYLIFFKIE